jgi:Mrp family chromosome partitioning ATPase
MSLDEAQARPARVIVVGNEKGGSGKSTVAMHVAVALVKARQKTATIDLDIRQRSLTTTSRTGARGASASAAISRVRSISVLIRPRAARSSHARRWPMRSARSRRATASS